jgi:hypothetical protein
MKAGNIFIAVTLFATGAAQSGFGGSLNLSTGQDGSGGVWSTGGMTDAYWTATTDPTFDPSGAAQTVFPGDADWFGGWVPDNPVPGGSDWIGRNASVSDNGPAPYSFNYTFDLADTTGASISGGWAIDDQGTLALNGNVIGSLSPGAWGALTAFSDSNASDFNVGLNTLTITITEDDRFLEGVNLNGTLTGDLASGTPEPSSWFLLASALGVVFFRKARAVAR